MALLHGDVTGLPPDENKGSNSVAECQRALNSDSASPYRWADLAEAFRDAHDMNRADYSFQNAISRGPHNPAILLRAANFYFASGRSREALPYLAVVLRDPDLGEYYSSVYLTYSRMPISIDEILLSSGIPRGRADEYQAWLKR